MSYLKNILVGIAAAVVAMVVWLGAWLGASIWLTDVRRNRGVVALVVDPYDMIVPTVIGFALGFWWSRRRQRRTIRSR